MSTDGNNVEEEGLVEEVGLEEEGQVVVVDPMIRQQQPPQPRINIKEKKKKSSNNNHNHIIQFVDHFSLEQPTSLVRFRGSKTIVHDLRNSQIQLEEQTTTTAMMTPLLEKNNDNNNSDNNDQRNSEVGMTTTTTTTILIKNVKDENTFALNALRVTYTLECLFFYGILFCFCLLTLVFLLMDIVVFAGADDSRGMSASIFGLLGTICAVPLYVHGLASAMAICGMYVCDTWNGHVFLRSLGQGKNNNGQDDDKNFYHRTLAIIYVEWATFCFLIGIPMLGFITGLFLGSDSWWNIGLLTWFSCVTAYFVFFAFCVIFYECQAAVYFLRQLAYKAATTGQDSNNNSSSSSSIGWGSLLRHAILIRQKVQFSGAAEYVRLTNKVDKMSKRQPEDEHKEEGDDNNNDSYDEDSTTLLQHNATGMYSRMTLLSCCGCIFEKLNHSTTAGAAPSVPGERLYSTADILGTRQFSTFQSWSLEKIFCSNHRIQTVAVVRPKNVALTRRQMKSSLACSIIGILLVMLTFISLVTWFMSAGGGAVVVVIIIVGICCFPRIRFTTRVYKMYQNVVQASHDDDMQHQEDDDDDNENGGAAGEPQGNKTVVVGDEYIEQSPEIDGIYQTYETYRMTIPKECFCWFVFFLEVICFLLGPTFVLFAMGNYAVAVLFIIVATLSVLRYYLNPAILVKELGSFDKVCPNNPEEEGHDGDKEGALRSDCQWNEKSRLSNILINVTRGPSRAVYIWIFSIFSLVSIVYTIAALNTTAEEAVSSNSCDEMKILPIGDFVYDQQNGLPYPTCQLKKGLDLPAGVSNIAGSAALLDYAYLSLWSYISPEFAQDYLDAWFGEGVAKNEVELILQFRGEVEGGQKAVSYRLITPTADPSFGVIAVRGSTTAWEFLTDAQLWLGSALLVILRAFLPFGHAWTPILHQVLNAITFIESTSLERVALYKQTTSLVNSLQNTGNFSTLHITGHSLGGGIAIITGAQTGIPAIGFSGPNALISRDTFQPKLTKDAINTKVFNVMPNRDIVPMVDLPGNLYQKIQCRAPSGSVFACHSITRSLCEIMYQCGTHGRPGICYCATRYGYPVPRQVGGNQTFSDICGDERENTYEQ